MTEQTTTPTVAVHRRITCDGCGASPMRGTGYVAKYLVDYDLCQDCFDEHTQQGGPAADYVAFDEPISQALARSIPIHGQTRDEMTRYTKTLSTSHDIADAAVALRSDETRLETVHLQILEGFDGRTTEAYEELAEAIVSNKTIKILHIHMCFGHQYGYHIAQVAQGIQKNTSLKKVFWAFPTTDRTDASTQVQKALYDMIENHETLEGMYFSRTCGNSEQQNGVDKAEDEFARFIIRALKSSKKLKHFRLDGYQMFSMTTKDLLVEMVKASPSLQRVYANFEDDSCDDCRLAVLLESNRRKWIARLTNERVPLDERARVLLEAQSSVEPVVALHYLLRCCPDICKRV